MEANRHNHITATYHLINKKIQRTQYMRDTFSTKKDNGDKRDQLKSQGAAKVATIDLNVVKPPARKIYEEELNQTMPVVTGNSKK